MRKILLLLLHFPDRIANFVMLRRKHVVYGDNLCINGRVRFHGNGKFVLGNNVTINSSEDSNPSAGGNKAHFTAGHDAVLKIGNRCGLSNCAVTAMTCVEIQDDVLIGSNTMIADTDFHSALFEERKDADDSKAKTAPVLIKKGAFIGARCIILKGVTIGERAVIGAGAVVTKDIPDGQVWGGNPARFIKEL